MVTVEHPELTDGEQPEHRRSDAVELLPEAASRRRPAWELLVGGTEGRRMGASKPPAPCTPDKGASLPAAGVLYAACRTGGLPDRRRPCTRSPRLSPRRRPARRPPHAGPPAPCRKSPRLCKPSSIPVMFGRGQLYANTRYGLVYVFPELRGLNFPVETSGGGRLMQEELLRPAAAAWGEGFVVRLHLRPSTMYYPVDLDSETWV